MLTLFDPARYAAANARARSGVANLVPPVIWAELLSAPTLSALVQQLSGTAYRDVLAYPAGEILDPGRVESALWQYLVRAYRAPLSFLRGGPRALVDGLWRRFEVDNLKTILRTVGRNVAPARVRASLIPLGSASDLPWEDLTNANSVSVVIDHLEATGYGHALEQALERYRREKLLFVLEVALDLFYTRQLVRILNGLSGRDRSEAERFVGTMVDSQNLLWAYRYRVHFDLSPEEILNYTLGRGLRVDAAVVRDIATGAPVHEVVTAIWNRRLPDVDRLANRSDAEALSELELIFWRYLYARARDTLQGYSLHLGAVLAYETLLESEVHDLVVLAEGTAAGWPPERIQPYFIGARG